jgi:hypothetical protein
MGKSRAEIYRFDYTYRKSALLVFYPSSSISKSTPAITSLPAKVRGCNVICDTQKLTLALTKMKSVPGKAE